MPLTSKLFAGDPALEACLVKDPAHLVEGVRGPHITKVQRALVLLDGAEIKGSEISGQLYGSTTARAVLAYKKKRSIINRSYQQTADNIVGKMTIAALDKEMKKAEDRPPLRGCTTDLGGGGGSSRRSLVEVPVAAFGDVGQQLVFAPGRLNVEIQEAVKDGHGLDTNSLRNVLLVARATELLKPFGLSLSVRFVDSFEYNFEVGERDDVDVRRIREQAEKAARSSKSALRVIFCHLRSTNSTATSQGRRTGIEKFDNFVLMNKDRTHPDHGTLLHEMIHCSNDRFMNDIHDKDLDSIYSRGANRTKLQNEHAASLNSSIFRT